MKSESLMGYLGDYLRWRGDLTFDQAPFCDADSLALTMLSYLNPEEVTAPGQKIAGVRLSELAQRYARFYTTAKKPGKLSMTARAPELLKLMAASKRFARVILEDYNSYVDTELEGQFAAMTFSSGRRSIYITYRGTDNHVIGWKEDFKMSYLESIPAQDSAVRYLEEQIAKERHVSFQGRRVILGGHSKGGNLAVYAAVCADPETAERILEVHNFDGPGFSEEFFENEGYPVLKERIVNFMPQGSIVGKLFEHRSPVRIVRSDARGVLQHVPFSWQIQGGDFLLEEDFNKSSRIFESAVASWLSGKDDEEKKAFIDALFDMLEESGIEKTEDLWSDKMRLKPVFRILRSMTREERDSFFSFFTALLRETGIAVQKNLFADEEMSEGR